MARKKVYASQVTVEDAPPRFVKRKRETGATRTGPSARTRAGRERLAREREAAENPQAERQARPEDQAREDHNKAVEQAISGIKTPQRIELAPKKPSKFIALGAIGLLAYLGWEFLKDDGE